MGDIIVVELSYRELVMYFAKGRFFDEGSNVPH